MPDNLQTPLAPSESFETLKAEIVATPEAEPRKKRGRPKGSTNKPKTAAEPQSQPEPAFTLDPVLVGDVLGFGFDYFAARRGAHWALSANEKGNLGRLTSRVIEKHSGEFMKRWGDEISLGVAFAMVLGVRIYEDARKLAEKKEQEARLKETEAGAFGLA